jgi:hypothetical protein
MTDNYDNDEEILGDLNTPDWSYECVEINAILNRRGMIAILMGKKCWLELSPLHTKALLKQLGEEVGESIDALVPQKSTLADTNTRNLNPKEKNTLLVLIAALCKEANIDPSTRGVASAIAKLTEQIGTPLSDDTIRKVLRQLDGARDARSK